jgi:hypothetical protein
LLPLIVQAIAIFVGEDVMIDIVFGGRDQFDCVAKKVVGPYSAIQQPVDAPQPDSQLIPSRLRATRTQRQNWQSPSPSKSCCRNRFLALFPV